MKCFYLVLVMACTVVQSVSAQESEDAKDSKQEIESLLTSQDAAWNDEDIESFMQTYWKSESLTFSGGGKTTRGWQATLDNYKKSYPKGSMGKLHFDGLETTVLSDSIALVLGNWHLDNKGKKRDGNFSLVMQKMDGKWKIIHDHSSTLEKEKGWITEEQSRLVIKSHFDTEEEIKFVNDDHMMKGQTGDLEVILDRKTGEVKKTK